MTSMVIQLKSEYTQKIHWMIFFLQMENSSLIAITIWIKHDGIQVYAKEWSSVPTLTPCLQKWFLMTKPENLQHLSLPRNWKTHILVDLQTTSYFMVHLVHLKMRVLNIRDGINFANEPNKIAPETHHFPRKAGHHKYASRFLSTVVFFCAFPDKFSTKDW